MTARWGLPAFGSQHPVSDAHSSTCTFSVQVNLLNWIRRQASQEALRSLSSSGNSATAMPAFTSDASSSPAMIHRSLGMVNRALTAVRVTESPESHSAADETGPGVEMGVEQGRTAQCVRFMHEQLNDRETLAGHGCLLHFDWQVRLGRGALDGALGVGAKGRT